MEVFNARLAFPSLNERAELFAQRYRIPAAAGSDAHVLPGLGTALTGMADFTGPEDFVAALDDSRIVRRRKSVLYLHIVEVRADEPRRPLQTPRVGREEDEHAPVASLPSSAMGLFVGQHRGCEDFNGTKRTTRQPIGMEVRVAATQ